MFKVNNKVTRTMPMAGRNGKIVWKHGLSQQKSLCYVETYQAPQNTGYHFKKTWLSLKGISYLQVIFVLIWMKQTLIWFNIQRDETRNGLSNIKDTFVENLLLHISVLHQSMCIFKVGLSSLNDGWPKCKEKVPMCQIPIKMLKQSAIPNSSLQN